MGQALLALTLAMMVSSVAGGRLADRGARANADRIARGSPNALVRRLHR
jgi:hypothetical protein